MQEVTHRGLLCPLVALCHRYDAGEVRMMSYHLPHNWETRPLVVLGAGTLGRRIALVQARGGSEVRLVDPSRKVLDEAKAYLASELPALSGQPGTLVFREDLPSTLEMLGS
jgi:3-hydroxybutyryl-CoA dehydrogenase